MESATSLCKFSHSEVALRYFEISTILFFFFLFFHDLNLAWIYSKLSTPLSRLSLPLSSWLELSPYRASTPDSHVVRSQNGLPPQDLKTHTLRLCRRWALTECHSSSTVLHLVIITVHMLTVEGWLRLLLHHTTRAYSHRDYKFVYGKYSHMFFLLTSYLITFNSIWSCMESWIRCYNRIG